jgi:hypothetical protein
VAIAVSVTVASLCAVILAVFVALRSRRRAQRGSKLFVQQLQTLVPDKVGFLQKKKQKEGIEKLGVIVFTDCGFFRAF